MAVKLAPRGVVETRRRVCARACASAALISVPPSDDHHRLSVLNRVQAAASLFASLPSTRSIRRARQPAAAGPVAARRPRRSDALGGAPQRPCAARRPRGAPLALMPPSGAAREAEEEPEYDGTFPPTAQARGRRRSAALGRRLCDAESSRRVALFRRLRRTAAAAARARTSPAPGTPPPSRRVRPRAPPKPQSPPNTSLLSPPPSALPGAHAAFPPPQNLDAFLEARGVPYLKRIVGGASLPRPRNALFSFQT